MRGRGQNCLRFYLPAKYSQRHNRMSCTPDSQFVNVYVRWHIFEPHSAFFEHRHMWLEPLCVNVTQQIQYDAF
ncbi:MAG: hypothetical protein DMG67_13015 [Acidobacteria bacterium]|nr:MAG: hypothetical protein DMG67_13015 [Acidobacteriota bacterium]